MEPAAQQLPQSLIANRACDVGLEIVEKCDLCGGQRQKKVATYAEYLLFLNEKFSLVRCLDCGLKFLSPRPTRQAIGRYYPSDYIAHANISKPLVPWHRRAGRDAALPRTLWERMYLHVRQSISWYYIPPRMGQASVLDIGCGSGKFLDIMKHLGWQTHGIEPSPNAASRGNDKGHQIKVGGAEDTCFPSDMFDVVYMWHSLEHTHSPQRALANCRSYIKENGQLILCVPNHNSFHAKLYGRYWWSSDAPRHLYQFTRASITRYIEQAGFRVVSMTTRTGASSWVRGFRHTVNGLLGTRWSNDPAWMLEIAEALVIGSSLFRFFGVGSELRIRCEPV